MDQHTGGKWLIHDTKHHEDNSCKSWNSPAEPPEYTHGKHPDSKVHGANVGPTWVLSAPDGPHVGPMNIATRAPYRPPTRMCGAYFGSLKYNLCSAVVSLMLCAITLLFTVPDWDLTELCQIVYVVHHVKATTVATCDVNDFILRRRKL